MTISNRPRYNPTACLQRKARELFGVLLRFGEHGAYIITAPSEATMERLPERKTGTINCRCMMSCGTEKAKQP